MKDNLNQNNAADAQGNGKNLSPFYEVVLKKTQECYCHLPVPAWSEEEALRNAAMWAPSLALDWQSASRSFRACKASKISKEQNN